MDLILTDQQKIIVPHFCFYNLMIFNVHFRWNFLENHCEREKQKQICHHHIISMIYSHRPFQPSTNHWAGNHKQSRYMQPFRRALIFELSIILFRDWVWNLAGFLFSLESAGSGMAHYVFYNCHENSNSFRSETGKEKSHDYFGLK